jgi:hypothetical protein
MARAQRRRSGIVLHPPEALMRPALLLSLFLLLTLGCTPRGELGTPYVDDDDSADDDDAADDDDLTNPDDDDTVDPDDDDTVNPDDDDTVQPDDDDTVQPDDDDAVEPEVALGYVHDQATVLTTDHGIQQDMWVRIAVAGEPGMDSFELRPGLYTAGANGVHQQGGGDDVLVASLGIEEVTITPGAWLEAEEADASGPSYPSGHYNEGDPTEYTGAGWFQAGVDTGDLPVTVSHPDHDAIDTNLQVVPPDWCPLGVHDGGSWNPGVCE